MKLIIDFGAIFHSIRRWWFRLFGRRTTAGCCDCGKPLTVHEREYYEDFCERCESINFKAMDE